MAANETKKDNDVSELIFCTSQQDIRTRPQIEILEKLNWRLDLAGQAKPGKTRGLMGTGTGLALQGAAVRVFGRFGNRTEPLIPAKPAPLAGYPDPLLTPAQLVRYVIIHDISLHNVIGVSRITHVRICLISVTIL